MNCVVCHRVPPAAVFELGAPQTAVWLYCPQSGVLCVAT